MFDDSDNDSLAESLSETEQHVAASAAPAAKKAGKKKRADPPAVASNRSEEEEDQAVVEPAKKAARTSNGKAVARPAKKAGGVKRSKSAAPAPESAAADESSTVTKVKGKQAPKRTFQTSCSYICNRTVRQLNLMIKALNGTKEHTKLFDLLAEAVVLSKEDKVLANRLEMMLKVATECSKQQDEEQSEQEVLEGTIEFFNGTQGTLEVFLQNSLNADVSRQEHARDYEEMLVRQREFEQQAATA